VAFKFRPVDETSARLFVKWRYDPPYDVYDEDPEDLERTVQYFLDPQICCFTVTDAAGRLVAFCTFGPDGRVPGGDYSGDALDIGMGVRPDLTGQGRGLTYVDAVLCFARRTFSPRAFRVTVAEFNKRALRVWEKVGFRQVQRFERKKDALPFVILIREA
jgi:ribosomal-protein-alanine N-acetyltransferase